MNQKEKALLNDLINNDVLLNKRLAEIEKNHDIIINDLIKLKDRAEKEYNSLWLFTAELLKHLRKHGLIDDFRVISRHDPQQAKINGFAGPPDRQTKPGT